MKCRATKVSSRLQKQLSAILGQHVGFDIFKVTPRGLDFPTPYPNPHECSTRNVVSTAELNRKSRGVQMKPVVSQIPAVFCSLKSSLLILSMTICTN